MTAANARLRKRLVGRLEHASAIESAEVRAAFLATPREAFIASVAVERVGVYQEEAFKRGESTMCYDWPLGAPLGWWPRDVARVEPSDETPRLTGSCQTSCCASEA